jgi:uncharacterized membrane protein
MPNDQTIPPPTRNYRTLIVTGTITILITIAITVLSVSLGGFASQDTPVEQRALDLPTMVHLATVLPALLLGPVILLRRKGDRIHRRLGRVWVALMLATAIASAFIQAPGAGIAGTGFSLIHIFTVWTLVNAPLGIWLARKGHIAQHRSVMTGLYIGLVIAGAFTLIPGRLLGNLVFG